jgi:hypothetical protein
VEPKPITDIIFPMIGPIAQIPSPTHNIQRADWATIPIANSAHPAIIIHTVVQAAAVLPSSGTARCGRIRSASIRALGGSDGKLITFGIPVPRALKRQLDAVTVSHLKLNEFRLPGGVR